VFQVCYAKELKEGFVEYTEQVVKLMVPLLKFYFHDDILLTNSAVKMGTWFGRIKVVLTVFPNELKVLVLKYSVALEQKFSANIA